jgi:hypothetical protein
VNKRLIRCPHVRHANDVSTANDLEDAFMESGKTRRKRVTAVVITAVLVLVAFASLGGAGLAQSAVGLAQYQYGKKVTICHKGKKTIRISVRAWPAHKRHGDTLGACIVGAKTKHGKNGAQTTKHHSKNGAQVHDKTKHDGAPAAKAGHDTSHGDADAHGHSNGDDHGKGNSK